MLKDGFEKYIKENNVTHIGGEKVETCIDRVKGMFVWENLDEIINLSSERYKGLDENSLITEISKTILHEHLHELIFEVCNNTNDSEGEEKTVRLLTGQKLPEEFNLE